MISFADKPPNFRCTHPAEMLVWKYCEISMKALCSSSRLAVMNVARRVGLWRAKQLSCAGGGLHFASLHRTWRVKTILLYSEATKHRKPLRVKYSWLQKSGLCMCTMKPFAEPGPEQNAKFRLWVVTMVTIVTLHSCCHCTGHETTATSMYQNPPLHG